MGVSLIRLLSVAMEFFVGIDEAFFALQWTYLSRMRLPTKQTYFAWGFLSVGVLSISHFLSLPYDSITERQHWWSQIFGDKASRKRAGERSGLSS